MNCSPRLEFDVCDDAIAEKSLALNVGQQAVDLFLFRILSLHQNLSDQLRIGEEYVRLDEKPNEKELAVLRVAVVEKMVESFSLFVVGHDVGKMTEEKV